MYELRDSGKVAISAHLLKRGSTMIKKILILIILILSVSCSGGDEESDSSGNVDYRQEMRNLVIDISEYAKDLHSGFIIIPQNGIELVTEDGESDGEASAEYLAAIDGNGQEDLFYGYDNDDEASPASASSYLTGLLDVSKSAGNVILAIDYCSTTSNVDDSYSQNNLKGYVSFAADERALNSIPAYPASVYGENTDAITSFSQVQNFLYMINPENYATKADFITAVTATNYDLLIMDLFFNDGTAFTASEINDLKDKANGGKRLVISYMSIGEAEDYRYYWNSSWKTGSPSWIAAENPDWAGNYKVKYWNDDWQTILFGNDSSYLKMILDSDFDGVYLDIIDAFEYFESE